MEKNSLLLDEKIPIKDRWKQALKIGTDTYRIKFHTKLVNQYKHNDKLLSNEEWIVLIQSFYVAASTYYFSKNCDLANDVIDQGLTFFERVTKDNQEKHARVWSIVLQTLKVDILICLNPHHNEKLKIIKKISEEEKQFDCPNYGSFPSSAVLLFRGYFLGKKPQCVICNKVLSNDSMRPTKLKQHLENVHPQHKDSTGLFQENNHKVIEASYAVALEIAKHKKPHTIAEMLIKPYALKMVEIVLGNSQEKKIESIPLSDNTIQRRIDDMAIDIKNQVIEEIKCAQLLVFARYVHSGLFKEEFLFCTPLKTTTKATDILEKVKSFFEKENLLWNASSRSGFQVHMKNRSPNVKCTHCMIHRQALASKTLSGLFATVLDQGALNS
ncbi:hypothetical protein AGLY_006824 [Aphis glycines]|uniref:BED-type domain-containing protein n=1 Tax=Aphis glycines TaxID=307491 RepID=A0A6G0TSP4_APHGL|nr:hypothetical protein AGLY_006824 [Aphis glycines]